MILCLLRGNVRRKDNEMEKERTLNVGDHVIYHDATGRAFNALVTAVHGEICKVQWREDIEGMPGHWNRAIEEGKGPVSVQIPCINVVHVSGNIDKQDPYGRQIERDATSVVHKGDSTAHGYYFRWPDEEPNPVNPSTKL